MAYPPLILCCLLCPQAPGPDGQLLAHELQVSKLIVQAVQFPAEDCLIVPLFLLQGSNFEDPP